MACDHFVETCKTLFNSADDDGNGYLDPEEFKAVLISDALDLQLSPDELQQILLEADQDGDGTITLDEFIPVVKTLFYKRRKRYRSAGAGNPSLVGHVVGKVSPHAPTRVAAPKRQVDKGRSLVQSLARGTATKPNKGPGPSTTATLASAAATMSACMSLKSTSFSVDQPPAANQSSARGLSMAHRPSMSTTTACVSSVIKVDCDPMKKPLTREERTRTLLEFAQEWATQSTQQKMLTRSVQHKTNVPTSHRRHNQTRQSSFHIPPARQSLVLIPRNQRTSIMAGMAPVYEGIAQSRRNTRKSVLHRRLTMYRKASGIRFSAQSLQQAAASARNSMNSMRRRSSVQAQPRRSSTKIDSIQEQVSMAQLKEPSASFSQVRRESQAFSSVQRSWKLPPICNTRAAKMSQVIRTTSRRSSQQQQHRLSLQSTAFPYQRIKPNGRRSTHFHTAKQTKPCVPTPGLSPIASITSRTSLLQNANLQRSTQSRLQSSTQSSNRVTVNSVLHMTLDGSRKSAVSFQLEKARRRSSFQASLEERETAPLKPTVLYRLNSRLGRCGMDETDLWALRSSASEAIKDGDLQHGQAILTFIVKLSKALPHVNPSLLSLALFELAEVHATQLSLHSAIECALECLQLRLDASANPLTLPAHECRMLLCILFTRVANFKKAISFGQQVFDDFTQHPERLRNLSHVSYRAGLVDARWISFLSSLQKALGLDEQYKKAIEVQQILLNTATRVLDKTAKEAGLILSSLGFVSDVLEGEGISILEKKFNDQVLAMIAEGKGEGEDYSALLHGNTMYSLARMMLQQGQPLEAQPLIEEALATFKRVHGKDHLRVAFAMTTLASCYAVQPNEKKQRRALRLLDRAATIINTSIGTNCRELVETGGPYTVRASVLEMLNDVRDSRRAWETVYMLRERHFGTDHAKTAVAKEKVEALQHALDSQKMPRTVSVLLQAQKDRWKSYVGTCTLCGSEMNHGKIAHDNVPIAPNGEKKAPSQQKKSSAIEKIKKKEGEEVVASAQSTLALASMAQSRIARFTLVCDICTTTKALTRLARDPLCQRKHLAQRQRAFVRSYSVSLSV
eukprot:m.175233 g.175233  ORF g.175233 m.175233 type:complete len:1078 (+) comp14608_c0_seq9:115-3348(+)